MESNSFEEYTINDVKKKKEQQTLDTCFDELHWRFDANRPIVEPKITSTMFFLLQYLTNRANIIT